MPQPPNMPALIDQLLEATKLAKAATTEAREARKDARTAITELRAVMTEARTFLDTELSGAVGARLSAAVEKELEELGPDLRVEMRRSVRNISDQFDELARLYGLGKDGDLGLLIGKINERVPRAKCPTCNYVMDDATAADHSDVKPKPGDPSLCINCGEALTFDDKLVLRRMTTGELDEIEHADPDAWHELGLQRAKILRRNDRP